MPRPESPQSDVGWGIFLFRQRMRNANADAESAFFDTMAQLPLADLLEKTTQPVLNGLCGCRFADVAIQCDTFAAGTSIGGYSRESEVTAAVTEEPVFATLPGHQTKVPVLHAIGTTDPVILGMALPFDQEHFLPGSEKLAGGIAAIERRETFT